MIRPYGNDRYTGARPPPNSSQVQRPSKYQRINHIEGEIEANGTYEDDASGDDLTLREIDEVQDLNEYLIEYFHIDENLNEGAELSDINF